MSPGLPQPFIIWRDERGPERIQGRGAQERSGTNTVPAERWAQAWWERLRLATGERNSKGQVRTSLPRSLAVQGSRSGTPKPKQGAQRPPQLILPRPSPVVAKGSCLLQGGGWWTELGLGWVSTHRCSGPVKAWVEPRGRKERGLAQTPVPGPRARVMAKAGSQRAAVVQEWENSESKLFIEKIGFSISVFSALGAALLPQRLIR